MTDNIKAKTHLKSAERKLNDLSLPNIPEINRITTTRSLDLFNNLHTGNNLFIDEEIKTDIENIHTRLWNMIINADTEIRNLDVAYWAALPADKANFVNQANPLYNITWRKATLLGGWLNEPDAWMPHIKDRTTEYDHLHTYANYFNTANKINNIDLDITTAPGAGRAGIVGINQDLDLLFKTAPGNPNADYTLCDDQGIPLSQSTPGNYTLQIWSQTATLSGIIFVGRHLDLTGLIITPPNIDLSQPLKLSVNATYSAATIGVNNVNLVGNKKFELQLREWASMKNIADRVWVVNTYNGRPPLNTVTNEINNTFRNKFSTLQREWIFDALKHLDGARFAQLEEYGRKNGKEEEIKEELYQQIYRNFIRPGAAALTAVINNYDNFRTWFTGKTRDRNNDKTIISTAKTYENYLHNNLSIRVNDYIKDELARTFKDNHDNNMHLKTELSRFLTDIEGEKNDEEDVGGDKINQAVEKDIDVTINGKDLMKKYNRRTIFGIPIWRKDVSFMRFYNGANHEIKDQTVDIATNTKIEDFKNSEPVKYDLKTNIMGKNQISITINFPNKDKRYPKKEIILKQGEVSTLAKKILNCRDIWDFKVRTHIVYNMLISMVKISAKKNLSLKYRNPGTNHQREIIMDDKNIWLYDRDDTGAKRKVETLFDYDAFITTNTFHGTGDSRSLQTAIDKLMEHFTYAMNEYHEQYKNTTKSLLLKTNISANSFWTSPLKTIMNLRTVRKFDFTASTKSDDGKENVKITFEKNIITLKMWEIEIKGKNLGNLLEYRKNKVRIFDGVERNIIFTFYDELVKKLRENSKIDRSNFGVYDSLTKNTYIMDEDGQLGIVSREDVGDILGGKNSGIIAKHDLDDVDARGGRRICTAEETKEIFMNPYIMWKMIKTMNCRMRRL